MWTKWCQRSLHKLVFETAGQVDHLVPWRVPNTMVFETAGRGDHSVPHRVIVFVMAELVDGLVSLHLRNKNVLGSARRRPRRPRS